jgi:Fe-S cluster assembly iron-binding protein IscA
VLAGAARAAREDFLLRASVGHGGCCGYLKILALVDSYSGRELTASHIYFYRSYAEYGNDEFTLYQGKHILPTLKN